MLKFFRKIRHNLLSENNFSKYLLYAFGEILLVMVGILLALQVNNWNENRKAQAEEQILLKDLQLDFKDNLAQLEGKIRGTKLSETSIEQIVTTLMNQESVVIGKEELKLLHAALIIATSFDPKAGSLNEILSAGKLRIIQNKALRNKLSSWSSHLAEVKETEIWLIDNRKDINHYLSKKYPLANLFNQSPGWRQLTFDSNFSIDWSTIFKDLEFENLLSDKSNWHKYYLQRYGVLQQEIQEILNLIEQEIKK